MKKLILLSAVLLLNLSAYAQMDSVLSNQHIIKQVQQLIAEHLDELELVEDNGKLQLITQDYGYGTFLKREALKA